MESPRPSASSDNRRLSDVSFSRPDSPLQRPNDSFAESQQCSADPSAFLGFHVPPSAEEVALPPVKEKRQTLKLVLDLEATAGVTRGSDGFRPAASLSTNPFSELFAEDTQADEDLMPEKKKEEKEESSPLKRHKQEKIEHRNRSPSPPPTMLKAVETAWRARKEKVTSNKDEDAENSLTAYSEYSEDLAPRIFRSTLKKLSDTEEKNAVEEKKHVDNSIIEDSDRETDYEDEMECTQQLEEEEDDGDMTQSYGGAGVDDEAETEVYPYSDTGTLPYGICSSTLDGVDSEEKNSESKEAAQDSLEKDSVVVPTPDQKSNQRSCEDEVTSREGSQATQQDYLTPRVNPVRVKKPDSAEVNSKLVNVALRDNDENVSEAPNDEEQEDCVPTQPTKTGTEAEPVVEPNSPSQNAKNSDDLLANKPAVGADSQTKAIRSLEFSFSIPSQDGEPHFSASLTSEGTPAKRIEAFSRCDRPSPFESSISPVYLSTPTPTPTPVDNPTAPEGSITMGETQVSSKRKIVSSPQSDTPTGKKKQKTSAKVDSPNQITSTPTAKKRRREFLPPDGNMSSEDDAGDPQTPRPPARRNTRSTQSTPTSTPQVRTRTRTLTPVPSQRAYGSRSRTLFKYKFEFCLTGFVKTGEETLKELIEGHGGKIPERYQDVLYKNNPKAVVIATPVSWRKRKFMQAVACGIPVVHTDWIKDCIDAGYVVPFDGYQVPTGYSVTTRKFECFPPRELHIFEGFSFGIVSDVSQVSKSEAKDKANLMAFILKACGADAVYENLSSKSGVSVDVVLCEEYTPTCRYYKRKRLLPVKDFQWVTECMILQKFLNPEESVFEPHRVGSEDVFAASAEIGDSDHTRLKLYTGELVMADISGSAADHYLLFNVCEILSIHVSGRKDEGSQSKRKDNKESRVMLQVGMLKREPYNPELSKTPVKVLDILSSQVKRRVVAISKEDYSKLKYKDESIFYLEDDSKPDKSDKLAVSEHRWLTQ
ncbi:hypothetical protein JG687_00002638 [Phytophthora cactorum]|uniref:BRCT domain-containing protein n=1 Tax=Phytophthora cactorum TaxID=29920 RepID=A0A329SKN2_9STRA|nr:hypothetical protein Pcac1_g4020 [Phytophthora cactorum]KAG2839623.1 hypothetical protein PC112_g4037 [Phytophthora cactorum]KAG2844012.1 hypothetical protein PC111_g2155 [Phytophthora cactorum]KAG2865944.1 hypothetical protein PC113_g3291 [Phytophthora cactorum]KAG2928222.1 hypothetical protein PC114_g3211 [Phytophthora cactorum]